MRIIIFYHYSFTHFDIIYYDKVTMAFRILKNYYVYSVKGYIYYIFNTLFYNIVGKK